MGWDHDRRRAKDLHGNGRDLLKHYFQHAHGKKQIQTGYIPTTRLRVTCQILNLQQKDIKAKWETYDPILSSSSRAKAQNCAPNN